MAAIGGGTRIATSDPGWGGFRNAMCWLFAGIGVIYGLLLIAFADGWLNDTVRGSIYVVASLFLTPPALRRVRARWSAARPVWAPIAYAWALGLLSLAISVPFTPSQTRQRQLEAVAISDARSLLDNGNPAGARMRVRKFGDRAATDPALASLLAEIDRANVKAAVTVTHVPPASSHAAGQQAALNEAPQSPADNFAERLAAYWIPQAQSLPDEPPEGEAYGKLLSQIDTLALDLEDGQTLTLSKSQQAVRAKFISILAAKQRVLYPKMRKAYAEALDQKMFRDDIRVSATGSGSTTLRFTGASFSLNANIEDTQQSMRDADQRLRFRRVEYMWSRFLNDGSRYGLKTPDDAAIGYWSGDQFERTDSPSVRPHEPGKKVHDPACVPALAKQVSMTC